MPSGEGVWLHAIINATTVAFCRRTAFCHATILTTFCLAGLVLAIRHNHHCIDMAEPAPLNIDQTNNITTASATHSAPVCHLNDRTGRLRVDVIWHRYVFAYDYDGSIKIGVESNDCLYRRSQMPAHHTNKCKYGRTDYHRVRFDERIP